MGGRAFVEQARADDIRPTLLGQLGGVGSLHFDLRRVPLTAEPPADEPSPSPSPAAGSSGGGGGGGSGGSGGVGGGGFPAPSLTLARSAQIPPTRARARTAAPPSVASADDGSGSDGVVPLVDLRPLGAPVAYYAARGEALRVNGAPLDIGDAPLFVIFDTGLTGAQISRNAYERLGGGVRELSVTLATEGAAAAGPVAAAGASGASSASPAGARRLVLSARRRKNRFFIVTPVDVPWFDTRVAAELYQRDRNPDFTRWCAEGCDFAERRWERQLAERRAAPPAPNPPADGPAGGDARASGGAFAPGDGGSALATAAPVSPATATAAPTAGASDEVAFTGPVIVTLGLAFLAGSQITIDVDSARLRFQKPLVPSPAAAPS